MTRSDERLGLQPAQVALAADRFTECSIDLAAALDRARRDLDGLGQPWGDDDPGREFARDYLPNQDAAFQVILLMRGTFSGVATALQRMGTTTVAVDRVAATDLQPSPTTGQPSSQPTGGSTTRPRSGR